MRPCFVVLIATVFNIFGDVYASENQELILKPPGDVLTKPLTEALVLTCQVTNADEKVDYAIKWIGADGSEITERTGSRRYIEEDLGLKKLYLTRISQEDAGQYTCNANVSGQVVKKSTQLNLFQEITFVNVSLVQHLKINTDGLVRCNVLGSPKPEVSWRFNANRIVSAAGTRYTKVDDGLMIKNVTTADSGEYTCRAEVDSDGRYDDRKIKVEVHIPPSIVEGPGNVESVEGGQATLECKVGAESVPKPTFKFFKDDSTEPLTSSDSIVIDNSTGRIEFKSLKKADQGKYKCTASNDVGQDSSSGSLKILVKPSIYELNNVTANENKTAVLTCKSHGDPVPTMTFSKQGQDPYPSGESSNGRVTVSAATDGIMTLTIKDLTPDDAANYVCRSNSTLGYHEMTSTITVHYTPRFAADHPRVVHGWAASSHNISCRATGKPTPRIEWLLRKEVLAQNETFHIYDEGSTSNLLVKIKPIDQSWIYGSYECRAINDIGSNSLPIELKRATVPDQPIAVNVTKRMPTMLVLSVQDPKENGGVPITGYRVEYKEKQVTEFAAGTKINIENLEPNRSYAMVVRAKNDVGVGAGINITAMTEPIREPSPVVITSPTQGSSAFRYVVTWEHPDTGGRAISQYEVRYRPVKVSHVNGNVAYEESKEIWKTIYRPDDDKNPMVEFTIENLNEMTSYEVEIKARNSIGWSAVNDRFVFTTSQVKGEEKAAATSQSPIGVGVVVAITVVILIIILVIVDLSCYFLNNCGLTSVVCTKVCGRSAALSKEKAAEEGESKEALTEKQSPVKEQTNGEQADAAAAEVEKAQTESNDAPADDHDEKPLLIDNADEKKVEPTDESKPDEADDEPVKKKIEDDEQEAPAEEKKEEEHKEEQPADTTEDGGDAKTTQPADG